MDVIRKGLVSISLNDKYVIRLELEDGKIKASINGELDENGIMFTSLITEGLKALQKGLSLNRYFNPNIVTTVEQADEDEKGMYMKLMWNRRGVLRIVGVTDKKYQHVEKPEDAFERKRVFTCDIGTLSMIPVKKC